MDDRMQRRNRAPRRRLGLLLLSVGLASLAAFGLAEVVVRIGISLDFWRLRDPIHYAHPFCDDTYHVLRYWWSSQKDLRAGHYVQDPGLGWLPDGPAPVKGAEDLGSEDGPRVALFGDSFMAGVPPLDGSERIRHFLASSLTKGEVVDFSVAGYGLDQIYLRFLDSLEGDDKPDIAVVGILLDDIDRVVERFRAGPKPYFVIQSGDLLLRGTPVTETPDEWISANSPWFRSYFLSLIRRTVEDKAEWRKHGRTVFESECRRGEKEALSQRLLAAFVEKSREMNVSVIFVLFYSQHAVNVENWRERFLKGAIGTLEAPVLDSKAVFLEAVAEGRQLSDLYFKEPNGHPNAHGSFLVADALAKALALRFGLEAERLEEPLPWTLLSSGEGVELDAGWEADGVDFRWTSAARASLWIEVPDGTGDLDLRLQFLCALKRPDDERALAVYVGGGLVGQEPLTSFPECWTAHVVDFVASGESAIGGRVEIRLELPYVLRPDEAGFKLKDPRRLGVALGKVQVRRRAGNESR